MLAMAGRVGAAEVKIGGSAAADIVPEARRRLGTEDVGIVVGAVTVIDEDGRLARTAARREVAKYLDVVAELDPGAELDPDVIAAIREALSDGDHERATALVPDDVLDRFAFSGTPEHVSRQANELFEAGASRIEFGTPHGLSPDRGIALLGSRVIPALS
jgi:5,10-methylenetetrahydromethanopterin reductase